MEATDTAEAATGTSRPERWWRRPSGWLRFGLTACTVGLMAGAVTVPGPWQALMAAGALGSFAGFAFTG